MSTYEHERRAAETEEQRGTRLQALKVWLENNITHDEQCH